MSGALSHIRVLDLSRILAGPWSGQVLADLGADVIKVERPGQGDDTRGWGPPYLKDQQGSDTSEAAYFLAANRGKRSLTIDFTRPQGRALVRELVARSDILLENFKVGGLRKYGLDYAALKPLNRGLIYCSITGFGQDGPYAQHAGYDFMIQAMGGLMSITGEPDDKPGGGPQKVGVALADILTGMYASVAVLAALAHRERSGEGQYIDLALLDVQVASLANQAMNYLTSGVVPRRLGNAHPNIVPYQAFATADGHLVIAVGNDGQFRRLCGLIECPELASDARYATNAARVANRDTLIPLLADRLRQRPSADWLTELQRLGIPGGPINTIDQVFADPQVRHRGMRQDLPHSLAGMVPLVASPLRLSATPIEYRRPPPSLGQHSDEILEELLGLDSERLAELHRQAVI